MKKYLFASIATLLMASAVFTASITGWANQPDRVRSAVVMTAEQSYTNGVIDTLRVYVSSSSAGGPQIPPGTSLGDAIAVFLTDGYHLDHVEGLIVYMSK